MKILLCHNFYQQTGGEDRSFADERRMLLAHGHQVVEYTRHNDEVDAIGPGALAAQTIWSRRTYREIRELIRRQRPDVVHCTNTFPLISPAVYDAARAEGTPIVQALRNYRLLCPAAVLMREGRVCQACMGARVPWPAVRHGCYRNSRAASAVTAGMLTWHRLRRTWQRSVDVYFTLTEFARQKFIEGGFPAERVLVKPNCIDPDPGIGTGDGGYFVFVGRLSPEKGVDTLLSAWEQVDPSKSLKIIGDGPLAPHVRAACERLPNVQWCGALAHEDTLAVIGRAAALVMPSRWYETFGRTIIEAYAKGTPVVASNLGAMADLVVPEKTGLLFEPGDAGELAGCVRQWDRMDLRSLRRTARAEYQRRFTVKTSYAALMTIYAQALKSAGIELSGDEQPTERADEAPARPVRAQPTA